MLSTLITLIAFFLILGTLVFIHELGHFAVAKWTGMRVDEFALGFPPRIWGRKRGETMYAINAIPFGGYVKIHGEAPTSADKDPRSFNQAKIWARIAVIIAGVVMNALFAFIILTIAFSIGFGSYAQDLTKIPGAVVKHSDVVAIGILADSPAAAAHIEAGDIIKSFTDPKTGSVVAVQSTQDMVAYTKAEQTAGVTDLKITYTRDGVENTVPISIEQTGAPLGISIGASQLVRVPILQAPGAALKEMQFIVELTWDALKTFAHKLFYSAQLDNTVSGPVGIYQATGQATQAGWVPTIFLVVALSLNLALLNILPIPALDGGRLFFLLIELIFGKKAVNHRLEGAVTFAGFVIVMGLVAILSVRDIIHLF